MIIIYKFLLGYLFASNGTTILEIINTILISLIELFKSHIGVKIAENEEKINCCSQYNTNAIGFQISQEEEE